MLQMESSYMERKHINMSQRNIRDHIFCSVVLFHDPSSEKHICHGLEYDIVGEGNTPQHALDEFVETLKGQMSLDAKPYSVGNQTYFPRTLLRNCEPAPDNIFSLYNGSPLKGSQTFHFKLDVVGIEHTMDYLVTLFIK